MDACADGEPLFRIEDAPRGVEVTVDKGKRRTDAQLRE
jgi:hypothetical protein